jgi:hypothetical protein
VTRASTPSARRSSPGCATRRARGRLTVEELAERIDARTRPDARRARAAHRRTSRRAASGRRRRVVGAGGRRAGAGRRSCSASSAAATAGPLARAAARRPSSTSWAAPTSTSARPCSTRRGRDHRLVAHGRLGHHRPEGVHVELGGFALLGGNDLQLEGPAPARARRSCAIQAWSLMGGTDVKTRSRRSRRGLPDRRRRAALNADCRGRNRPVAGEADRDAARRSARPAAAPVDPRRDAPRRTRRRRACCPAARPRSAGTASRASRCSSCWSCSSTSTPARRTRTGHGPRGQAAPRRGRRAQAREREAARAPGALRGPERARARGAAPRDGAPGERRTSLDTCPRARSSRPRSR